MFLLFAYTGDLSTFRIRACPSRLFYFVIWPVGSLLFNSTHDFALLCFPTFPLFEYTHSLAYFSTFRIPHSDILALHGHAVAFYSIYTNVYALRSYPHYRNIFILSLSLYIYIYISIYLYFHIFIYIFIYHILLH